MYIGGYELVIIENTSSSLRKHHLERFIIMLLYLVC